jgi:hypothetical protein
VSEWRAATEWVLAHRQDLERSSRGAIVITALLTLGSDAGHWNRWLTITLLVMMIYALLLHLVLLRLRRYE